MSSPTKTNFSEKNEEGNEPFTMNIFHCSWHIIAVGVRADKDRVSNFDLPCIQDAIHDRPRVRNRPASLSRIILRRNFNRYGNLDPPDFCYGILKYWEIQKWRTYLHLTCN